MTSAVPDSPGPIGWGDALTAAIRLGLSSGEQLGQLVELLGLTAPSPPAAPREEPALLAGPGAGPAPPEPSRTETMHSSAPDLDGAPAPDRRTVIEELDPEPFDVPIGSEEPLDPPHAGLGAVPYEPPVEAPLLRAAISMLVRRARPSDEVDLELIIDLVAEQRPMVTLPRTVDLSTAHGVTVIADVSAAMLPYLDDVATLVAEVEHVVGASQVDVEWASDRPPSTMAKWPLSRDGGRPVLVVSVLGAARPPAATTGSPSQWQQFLSAAQSVGSDVTLLVPHREQQILAKLRKAARTVSWDSLADIGRGRG